LAYPSPEGRIAHIRERGGSDKNKITKSKEKAFTYRTKEENASPGRSPPPEPVMEWRRRRAITAR
jgi:hypothetical protein